MPEITLDFFFDLASRAPDVISISNRAIFLSPAARNRVIPAARNRVIAVGKSQKPNNIDSFAHPDYTEG